MERWPSGWRCSPGKTVYSLPSTRSSNLLLSAILIWKELNLFTKKLNDCEEFIAGDNTILREILHPDKADLELRYSLAHAVLKHGKTSYPHALKTSEVYYILEGHGLMFIDEESREVEAHETIYIPPGAKQYIKNIGDQDLKFLAIVDPAWQESDEIIY